MAPRRRTARDTSSHSNSPPGEGASSTEDVVSTPPSSPPSKENSAIMEDEKDPSVSETMRLEEERMAAASRKQDHQRETAMRKEREKDMKGGKTAFDKKFSALEYLLSQSKLYSTIMLSQIQKQEEVAEAKDARQKKKVEKREAAAEQAAVESQRRSTRRGGNAKQEDDAEDELAEDDSAPISKTRKSAASASKKGPGKLTDYFSKESLEEKAGKGGSIQDALKAEADKQEEGGVKASDIGVQNLRSARQPDLVSGGTMRGYQLEGLEWLTSLYENGLNGILADEMGLGKTVQTISFLAFLRDKGVNGPFLIAAPLSTTSNWVEEFKRWTPKIPVVLYHGSKDEREEIRRKQLRSPGSETFPVVCTSYEICMNDRKFLAHYGWKYIIIDEGHRIKNLNCRLIRELQSYQSANRLLITGTPLQNNLAELWSLLHFLMPEIFDKLESFESWFDFSALKDRGGHETFFSEERRTNLVSSLHAILKPFLLRRVKSDVEHSMPKKREYILYAPLSSEQRELYQAILDGESRTYLEDKVVETLSRNASGANTPTPSKGTKRKAAGSRTSTPAKSAKTSRASTPATNGSIGRRSKKRQNYSEISDREYFKSLEENAEAEDEDEAATPDQERVDSFALAKKMVAQKKLSNPVMQLRLCCNSPHNFYDPFPSTYDESIPEEKMDYTVLLKASGKMQLLDRLLRGLLNRKDPATKKDALHKVLIFSQFKTQLDLLAMYIEEVLKHPCCRIDGTVANTDRQEQIHLFNGSPDHRVFLLSTRAGGQGINLAAADTVILFDSDWNPQQDLQAQDRAHRIGQRRNVIVYRLASRGTVEEMLLEKADGKRRLEKLVIQKGRFKSWSDRAKNRKSRDEYEEEDDEEVGSIEELKTLLGRDDGEKYDLQLGAKNKILSDRDLAILTDRSDEAYVRAEKGQDTGAAFKNVETKRDGEGLLETLGK